MRGGAVGAGLNLALATDLRVVADDAKLLSGFLPIGLHPGGGHSALLARGVGRETANAMQLFGATVVGAQAVELGLAWAAVPAADVDATALALAATPAPTPSSPAAPRGRCARSPGRRRSLVRRARARARLADVVHAAQGSRGLALMRQRPRPALHAGTPVRLSALGTAGAGSRLTYIQRLDSGPSVASRSASRRRTSSGCRVQAARPHAGRPG
ncbi:enoyl-CoA hydratase-related protein [Baekduia soli]|uniref:enoyl-CoA hydratase-related protein n=1 Tax=Baekduia soli TaxID=496014 RepID=UPI003899160F